ncbi:MAG: cell shape determination protein CcmA [Comamonas sp. SCN 67-35]|uniref:bactofilin family protein n=1 Tax=unclassified Comamonas TaxID=2638500 RepID=UPI00086C7CC6|nr:MULTISPECIES: polymer-forming cytoskeletal protein [unclassified Comamonas]MBN9329973.1 polymer-forming cytoskeletal protein [Comamonas sp.]ODU39609.1 MAG: cell shape determination protein CcmA [Comamonas sp. SCN 67-35]OJW99815.1 MAG: cell shape determination protein CcmA [Burkholderiales bacterium 66-26]
MFSRKKQPLIKSLIAKGTSVHGNVSFSDGLRIDGEVRGDVRAGGERSIVVISDSAVVQGAVHAAHVIVNGMVQGPVHAGELLELQPRGRVTGDVHYKMLEMHQGAVIAGQMFPSEMLLEGVPQLKLASSAD